MAAGIDSRARSGEVEHVGTHSQEKAEASVAASIISASGQVEAETTTDGDGSNAGPDGRSQEKAQISIAASIVSASRHVAVESAQTATDGSNVDISSPIVARRVVEPWGAGVNPDRTHGVAICHVTTI